MSLSITKSNALTGLTPTVTDIGIGQVASDVTNPDHSLTLSSGISVSDFSISFGAINNLTYVAISGHNAANPGGTSSVIQLFNDTTLIDSVTISRNNNIMFTFNLMNFTDLIVKFITSPTTIPVTVSYIAAGLHLSIETGEQAGYARNWLKRHLRQKTTTGLQSSPIATVKRRKPMRGNLILPNEQISFSRGDWQDFLDFAETQPFFIREVDSLPESSYICYDTVDNTAAHAQTRQLDVLRLSFIAYNGL